MTEERQQLLSEAKVARNIVAVTSGSQEAHARAERPAIFSTTVQRTLNGKAEDGFAQWIVLAVSFHMESFW